MCLNMIKLDQLDRPLVGMNRPTLMKFTLNLPCNIHAIWEWVTKGLIPCM